MENTERTNLVGPCGIDCGLCELYICKDKPELYNYLVGKGIPESKLPCKGCRPESGACPVIGETCKTYQCVSSKKISFCYQCYDFPCNYLHPSADSAMKLPHNMKVFNLCTIKKLGVENFVEISTSIRKRYFEGKMVIGKGPQLDS